MGSMNPLIVGVTSAIVAILAFYVDGKIYKKEFDKTQLLKVSLLGVCVGISNLILFSLLSPSGGIKSTQDIMTGQPNF